MSRRRPPLDDARVLDAARRQFLTGSRVDMQRLAAELGVSRVTLYRFAGTRDQVLGSVLLSFAEPAWTAARRSVRSPGERVTGTLDAFMHRISGFEPLRRFLLQEPEIAFRILTTASGGVQQRVVVLVHGLLDDEARRGTITLKAEARTQALLLVRIGEVFLYGDVVAAAEPDLEQARTLIRLVVT